MKKMEKIEKEIMTLLVQFGNYVLSEERQESIIGRGDLDIDTIDYKINHVTNEDIFKFFNKLNNK